MLAVTACGDDDFENEPRPAVPIQITGVITEERLTVSPNKFGAGPIVLTIANQTDGAHTVSLEGEGIQERVGPVSPEGTATIQKALKQGQYVVKAGSDQATDEEIRPATVVVGEPRDSASDELLLP
ncbi:MAG TPA: hypothetical protein VNT32_09395 [Thermoleophilaceae bacterium]|nr:hypothetical protein [Thermoleophilaceae bacterium]